MQRRGESGQPVKGRRALRPKARKAPTVHASSADLQAELDRRTRELDEALQQQTATSEVLRIIRRSPVDAQPVFDAIVQSAARLCGAIFSVVYLCDGDRVRIAATKNFTPEATSQLQQRQELKRPDRSHAGGRAILDRAIIHIHDVLADTEYSRELALAGGWRAVLAVPLLRDGISVGALTVAKPEPKPFSDRQIQLLNTFADQALIAIDNVRLFDDVQKRIQELSESLEQQTATSEVLQVISRSPGELETVFEAMLANATRICGAKFGTLYLYDGDAFHAAAFHNAPPAFIQERKRAPLHPGPNTSLGLAASTKQVAQIVDITKWESYLQRDPFAVAGADLGGYRTVVSVPMLKEDKLIGAISVYRQEVRSFTDKQIELVKNFAAQAVIAIENTRLLNELRQSLQQQTATGEILASISGSMPRLAVRSRHMNDPILQQLHHCKASTEKPKQITHDRVEYGLRVCPCHLNIPSQVTPDNPSYRSQFACSQFALHQVAKAKRWECPPKIANCHVVSVYYEFDSGCTHKSTRELMQDFSGRGRTLQCSPITRMMSAMVGTIEPQADVLRRDRHVSFVLGRW
jgi:GAF domain-containing protein